MQHRAFIGSVVLVLLVACEPPEEIYLVPDDSGVEVTSLLLGDTSIALSRIDSSALLPLDELTFDGTLVVNGIQHDAGQGIRTGSFAQVVIADRNRPVIFDGQTWGYHGFDLGSLSLNGVSMVRRLHFVIVPDTVVLAIFAGFEYANPPEFVFEPGRSYTWTADSIDGPGVTIEAPGALTVHSPAGGSVISRNEDLELRWTSDGDVVIVISLVEGIGRPKPLLHLKPRDEQVALLPAKILSLLPADQVYFFTFIRANRSEVRVVRRFFDRTVLVQAASVYNSVVLLR